MRTADALDALDELFEAQDDRYVWLDPTVDAEPEEDAPPEAPWWDEYVDDDLEFLRAA